MGRVKVEGLMENGGWLMVNGEWGIVNSKK
jgi:hypothetical protein